LAKKQIMKNKIALFSIAILSAVAFASCSGSQSSHKGTDSAGNNVATNPYRDTFATTDHYGDATTLDNTGSGGVAVTKTVTVQQTPSKTLAAPVTAAPAAKTDTTKAAK
jgi:hypothetical protein